LRLTVRTYLTIVSFFITIGVYFFIFADDNNPENGPHNSENGPHNSEKSWGLCKIIFGSIFNLLITFPILSGGVIMMLSFLGYLLCLEEERRSDWLPFMPVIFFALPYYGLILISLEDFIWELPYYDVDRLIKTPNLLEIFDPLLDYDDLTWGPEGIRSFYNMHPSELVLSIFQFNKWKILLWHPFYLGNPFI